MATYNVELRQRVSGTFGDTIYLKAHWSNIDGKPLTFTPTAHTHLYAGAETAGGAASTATKLHTARAITVGPTAKDFDGSAAITYTLAEIGINVVTTCPTAAATAGRVNIYTGAACATKYANWLYFETT